MLLGIICFVLIIISVVFSFKYAINDGYGWTLGFGPAIVVSIMVVLCCGLIGAIIVSEIKEPQYSKSYTDIMFIENISSMNINGGGSFLGWSINSSGVQNYHVTKRSGEGYIKDTLNAEKVILVESDERSPCIVYQNTSWVVPKNIWVPDHKMDRDTQEPIQIIVPVGTVIKQINKL
jgi:hypothetical protein